MHAAGTMLAAEPLLLGPGSDSGWLDLAVGDSTLKVEGFTATARACRERNGLNPAAARLPRRRRGR